MSLLNIFDNFKDTIILKDDSSITKQIEELKNISKKLTDNNLIKRDIKLLEYGLQGERQIDFELKNANLGMYVLHDITIKYEELKAQIDYIVITKGYVYLIECKNIFGNITVDNNGQFTRECIVDGKKYKESIYSPYTQALRHKDILKKIWQRNNKKLVVKINNNNFDDLWYKSLVVLSNPKGILNTKYAPKDMKDKIIRVDNLINYIKKDLEKYDKDLFSSKKNMEILAKKLLDMNTNEYNSIATKYESKKLVCPNCGKELIERTSKYGKFYGCVGYPKCKYTKNI